MARSSEMKALCKRLTAQGFDVAIARNGHYKVVAPDGRKCQIAATPRENRGVLNAITRLKRIGYDPALN